MKKKKKAKFKVVSIGCPGCKEYFDVDKTVFRCFKLIKCPFCGAPIKKKNLKFKGMEYH